MVNRHHQATLIAVTFLSVVAVARPATRHGADLGIIVEFSDDSLYGALGGAVCSSWLNHFPRALVYSDTLSEFPAGSSAARECSALVLVALTDVLPDAVNLNASIRTAQYKREFILIDAARRWKALPPKWIVSTEQDTWWSVDLLDRYIDALDKRFDESGQSSRDPVRRGATGGGAVRAIVAGAGPWGPFIVFTWQYIERFVELRLPCRSAHLACMCPGKSVSRVDDLQFLTDPVDPRDCEGSCSTQGQLCKSICNRRKYAKEMYAAAQYNTDHLVMCTLEDAEIVDWSVLCLEAAHVCPDATGTFMFWFNADYSSGVERRAPLAILQDWPHRAVAMHHVNASQMQELSDVEATMPLDPYGQRHWPTLFVLGVRQSATTTTFNAFLRTSQSLCRPTLFEGDPSCDKQTQYLEAPMGKFHSEKYLRRFVVNASSTCDRFFDTTPLALHLERPAWRLVSNMPLAVRAAVKFVVILRDPVDRILSWYNYCSEAVWRDGMLVSGCSENISFSKFVDIEVKKAGGKYSTHLAKTHGGAIFRGYYATHLQMWWRHFARRSFFIASFQQLADKAQTRSTLQRIFAFAKLSALSEAYPEEKANDQPWPGKLTRRNVSDETQCRLFAMYRTEMNLLPSLINANTTVDRTSWYGDTDADKQPPPKQPVFQKFELKKCANDNDAGDARKPVRSKKSRKQQRKRQWPGGS